MNIKFVRGDFTQESVLELANVKEARTVLILPDQSLTRQGEPDERTILATLVVRAMNPQVKIYAHVLKAESRGHLRRANVDDIILQDEFTGYLLAAHLQNPGIPQTFHELLDYNNDINIRKENIDSDFVGKTFDELAIHFKRERLGLVIGLTAESPPVSITDIMSADPSSLDDFIERKFRESGLNVQAKRGPVVRIDPPGDTVIEKVDEVLVLKQ